MSKEHGLGSDVLHVSNAEELEHQHRPFWKIRRFFSVKFLRRMFVILRRYINRHGFSSLSRRLIVTNIIVLLILAIGVLYLNEFRAGLINARIESLRTQGQIIAAAIAASASVETDVLTLNPEDLLELDTGESLSPFENLNDPFEFPLDPERIAPVISELVGPTKTRARLYDHESQLIIDSQFIFRKGTILRLDLPPPEESDLTWYQSALNRFLSLFEKPKEKITEYNYSEDGQQFPEVVQALEGNIVTKLRGQEGGSPVIYVAVPVKKLRSILGVLLLSTNSDEIETIVSAEQFSILRLILIGLISSTLISIVVAATVTVPIRKLSLAALKVQRDISERPTIPKYPERNDEIGFLADSLNNMTTALYQRLDAIEAFAADVSHELKNPLTSLRSAVETLPLVQNDEQRERLLYIIQHDVQRLDRLISDISDASRLDAELTREKAEHIELISLIEGLIGILNQSYLDEGEASRIQLELPSKKEIYVEGHASRLSQVLTNILDNAHSFSPIDTVLKVSVYVPKAKKSSNNDYVVIIIDDEGPGISAENINRIFERFYTDRSTQSGFGQNSGLGLSISKQIIESHGGTIKAENRKDINGKILGARFMIKLPLIEKKTKT